METLAPILNYDRSNIKDDVLLDLYKNMLRPRLIEEKMLILLRQGKISKWFSGIGQEAVAVGCTYALNKDEVIFPMHRNLGVFTTRKIPLERLFCQWQGKALGFTNGRDRSFHFGTMAYNVVGMISHLGPQLSLAAGVALAHKTAKEKAISIAFSGEGGTSQGEFHEALNTAAVWNLPVIFVVENNGYGLSTPTKQQFKCKDIADKGIGYGMRSVKVDGNNILEMYHTISQLAAELRENPEPVLVEAKTFRMRGHEEASGTKYVPKDLMAYWAERDPIENYEHFLKLEGLITEETIDVLKKEIKQEIIDALEVANNQPPLDINKEKEIKDVFAQVDYSKELGAHKEMTEMRFVDAIHEGLDIAMETHDNLTLMGQDIADYGGVFKITDGFLEKYGEARVKNTPLCESAIAGICVGMSLKHKKTMMELQFADFVTCAFNQITNNMAKLHYRWGQNVDTVLRMPTGGTVAAGPFHSQSTEAWFYHTPGLKIFYPSNPRDAKGLLLAAFEDPNPVLFFEHKALYRSLSGDVPDGYYITEPGRAGIVHEGSKATIITYGMGVHWANDHVTKNNLDVEVIDLKTLVPLDYDAIKASVEKTNRVLILHEDVNVGGIGGDISSYISEHLFKHLDAPVVRVSSMDTPIPFQKELEKQFMGSARLEEALDKLLKF